MQIQVNTDPHIEGRDELTSRVSDELSSRLQQFTDRLSRLEAHLSDRNAGKGGGADKRCMLEARPLGHQPVAVTNDAATLEEAYEGAAEKMQRRLDTFFGKLGDSHKGAPSIRDNENR